MIIDDDFFIVPDQYLKRERKRDVGSLNEDLRLCLIDLADYGFGASSFRAEIDLDRTAFREGKVSSICRLEGNQQSEKL